MNSRSTPHRLPPRASRLSPWLGLALLLAGPALAAAGAAHAAGSSAPAGARPGATAPPPGLAMEARVCVMPTAAGPPLEAFGTVLWRRPLKLGPAQAACLGDLYYGPGASVEVGLLASRYRDRVYFRTGRRLLREWTLPAPGQPDSARAWAEAFAARFAAAETLFVDLSGGAAPTVATGARARRMTTLFEHWVARDFAASDQNEATALGLPAQRFKEPPPEAACAPGGG